MDYIEQLSFIVERSSAFAGKHVRISVIINPVAGGFTIPSRVKANKIALEEAVQSVSDRKPAARSCSCAVFRTESAGHASRLARAVFDSILEDAASDVLHLVVTAGGDGTSLDVQAEMAKMVLEEGRGELSDRVCLLRLPFGTGNDGSDGRTLSESFTRLVGDSRFEFRPAVVVRPNNCSASPWYAFNIASLGLDAFVTHMTNHVKRIVPGDVYKIWVDAACLFYNRLYPLGSMRVNAYSADGTQVSSYAEPLLLQVMGVSGYRTYGSNQRILPDERNVCAARDMSLLRKLSLKKYVKEGTHAGFPEIIMYTAAKLVINYDKKILVQMDGESHLLDAASCPLVMELSKPFMQVLVPQM